MTGLILTNKETSILYHLLKEEINRLVEKKSKNKKFTLDDLKGVEEVFDEQQPKVGKLNKNIEKCVKEQDKEGLKKAIEALEKWENADDARSERQKTLKFVDSSMPTKEEMKLGVKAYKSEMDFRHKGKKLMKLSEEECQKSVNDMLALGYSQEAIDFIMQLDRENDFVVLPFKIRNYQEFSCMQDACDHYNCDDEEELSEEEPYKKISNGHVLVLKMPDEMIDPFDY